MDKGVIISINQSEKKGTIKLPVESALVDKGGMIGDAHYGMKNKQISILSKINIDDFSMQINQELENGVFAENLTIDGIDLKKVSLLDVFISNEIKLLVVQIGKNCHNNKCSIFQKAGCCLMPEMGVFCRVLSSGKLFTNNTIEHIKKIYKVKIITISDRASQGEYKDKSGEKLQQLVERYFNENCYPITVERIIVPDDKSAIKNAVHDATNKYDIIFSTGGTGIGSRDITPDIVKPLLEKEIPGVMEFIRVKYGTSNPNSLLSRSFAGIIGTTLVYGLPGSTKAVSEYFDEISKTIIHSIYMIHNIDSH